MRPQSCKAKGRKLQQETRDAILASFSDLTPDDVRSTSMGASGVDILLSSAAKKRMPFSIENKNVESINVHQCMIQAIDNTEPGCMPLLVFRKNRSETFCCMRFSDLLAIMKRLV